MKSNLERHCRLSNIAQQRAYSSDSVTARLWDGTPLRWPRPFILDQVRLEDYACISEYEGDWSCPVELSFRLLHPRSSASRVLRLFQLTPSHIEEAWELAVLAFITVVSIGAASIAAQPCAVEWRWASEPLRSALLPTALTRAADILPTHRATSGCCNEGAPIGVSSVQLVLMAAHSIGVST